MPSPYIGTTRFGYKVCRPDEKYQEKLQGRTVPIMTVINEGYIEGTRDYDLNNDDPRAGVYWQESGGRFVFLTPRQGRGKKPWNVVIVQFPGYPPVGVLDVITAIDEPNTLVENNIYYGRWERLNPAEIIKAFPPPPIFD